MAAAARRTVMLCVAEIQSTSSRSYVKSSLLISSRNVLQRQTRLNNAKLSTGNRSDVRCFSTSWRWNEAVQIQPRGDADGQPVVGAKGSKLFKDADEAVADLRSGSTILSAGFGLCGTAETIITAIRKRGVESLNNLTAVSNNAGASGEGGLSPLTRSGQITRCILSYLGNNKPLEQKYLDGRIAIELCPQGTLAERIRAGGSGIPAFYTPTGVSKLNLLSFPQSLFARVLLPLLKPCKLGPQC